MSGEQYLKLMLDQDCEHAIIMLDPKGLITGWYCGAESVFGYKADDVIGRPSSMLFVPEDVQKGMPSYEMAVASHDRDAEDDRWMLRKDGMRIWVTGTLAPLKDENEQLIGYGKILRNRTDLKSRLEWLEKQVQTHELAIDRKNNFISTLAHEIRNPLAAISTALELLNKIGSQDPNGVFARATIARQVEFLSRLVHDLLEVTRAGTGKIQLKKEIIPIQDAISAAVDACRPAVDLQTHDFDVIMPDAPIFIEADRARLQQVFVNLIENACKYTQYGGRIWIKATVEGNDAIMKVEDNGIGISPEVMPLIFDLFTQAEFDVGRRKEGLGIGLSVVRDLVTLHGGSVHVRSDGIGKGSEFTVRLPLSGPDLGRPNRPELERYR